MISSGMAVVDAARYNRNDNAIIEHRMVLYVHILTVKNIISAPSVYLIVPSMMMMMM